MDDTMRNTILSQSRTQKFSNHRHLQADPRSVGRFLVRQDSTADPLENLNAWGTGKNDLALRG